MRGRWLALALLVSSLALPAQGALTLAVEAPGHPIPVDGSATVKVTVVVDCIDEAVRAPAFDIPIAVAAPGLAFEGPAQVRANLLDCRGVPPTWTGVAEYAVNGSRYLPGLVAIAANATASLASPPHPLLAVADANASFEVVPAAILDDDFAAMRLPPTVTKGALDIPATLVSRSNVDVTLVLEWSGDGSLSHDGGRVAPLSLPRGGLALPTTVRLPRATDADAPGQAEFGMVYVGPEGHAGRDRFVLAAKGTADLDPALETASEAVLEVPYDLPAPGKGESGMASEGRAAAHLAPVTSRAAPAVGLLALAALVACAFAARARDPR